MSGAHCGFAAEVREKELFQAASARGNSTNDVPNARTAIAARARRDRVGSVFHLIADVVERLANLATTLTDRFPSVSAHFIDFAFVVQPVVAGDLAGRFLGLALRLVHLALEFIVILHGVSSDLPAV